MRKVPEARGTMGGPESPRSGTMGMECAEERRRREVRGNTQTSAPVSTMKVMLTEGYGGWNGGIHEGVGRAGAVEDGGEGNPEVARVVNREGELGGAAGDPEVRGAAEVNRPAVGLQDGAAEDVGGQGGGHKHDGQVEVTRGRVVGATRGAGRWSGAGASGAPRGTGRWGTGEGR